METLLRKNSFDEIVPVTAGPNSGPEKRLEVDFSSAHKNFDESLWQKIPKAFGDALTSSSLKDGILSLICEQSLVVVTELRVVVLSSAHLQLHRAADAVKQVAETIGVEVQWASFTRKNTMAPWNDTDSFMAREFVELKHAFPKGHPFLFGPVDGDHYLCFVYDNIARDQGVVESDVQVNLVMYECGDISPEDTKEVLRPTAHYNDSQSLFQGCAPLPDGAYEILRVDRSATMGNGTIVTYETTESMSTYADIVGQLIRQFEPKRFSIIVLADPHSAVAENQYGGDFSGTREFDGFKAVHRTTNEFAPGYAMHKTGFVSTKS